MRKRLHVLLAEAGKLPPLDPRPGANVGDGVLALAVAGEEVARLARVLAAELDLEHAVDTESFVAETLDGVWVFVKGGVKRVSMLLLLLLFFLSFLNCRKEGNSKGKKSRYDDTRKGNTHKEPSPWQTWQSGSPALDTAPRYHAKRTTTATPGSSPTHP